MAKASGRTFLLKKGDGATPTEAFTTVTALTNVEINGTRTSVQSTDKEDAGVQKLFEAAGVKSLQITGSGFFDDSANQDAIIDAFNDGSILNYQIIDGVSGNYWQGPFQVSSLAIGGNEAELVTFSITLDSAGAVPYTVA